MWQPNFVTTAKSRSKKPNAKHQNSVNSKNPHMYLWKIIHSKHKRIALQSLINSWEKVWGQSPKTFCQLIKAEPEVVLSSLKSLFSMKYFTRRINRRLPLKDFKHLIRAISYKLLIFTNSFNAIPILNLRHWSTL